MQPTLLFSQDTWCWSCTIFCVHLLCHGLTLGPAKWLEILLVVIPFLALERLVPLFRTWDIFLKLQVVTKCGLEEPFDGLWIARIMFLALHFQHFNFNNEKKMSWRKLRNFVLILSAICFWHNVVNLWQFAETLSRQWYCLDYKVSVICSSEPLVCIIGPELTWWPLFASSTM